MDTGSFTKIAIGTVIVILVIVMVTIPILDGITYTETRDNEPTGYATSTVPNGTYTISNGKLLLNGTEITSLSLNDWFIISDSCAMVKRYVDGEISVYDYEGQRSLITDAVTINGNTWSAAQSNTTYTGNIGPNAVALAVSGPIGTYRETEFMINKDSNLKAFEAYYSQLTVGGTTYSVRAIYSGSPDNLTVEGIALVSGNNATFLDPETVGATARISNMSENDMKTYKIASDPKIILDFTYGGVDYHGISAPAPLITAPLSYTYIENSPMESLLGIAPLIMLAGVIMAVIGTFIVRRS